MRHIIVGIAWAFPLLVFADVKAPHFIPPTHDRAPNPQVIRREMLDLNGLWRFRVGEATPLAPNKPPLEIRVPFVPESEMSGLSEYGSIVDPGGMNPNVAWIKAEIVLPEDWKEEALHFQNLGLGARVFIQNKPVGSHKNPNGELDVIIDRKVLGEGIPVPGGRKYRVTALVEDSSERRAKIEVSAAALPPLEVTGAQETRGAFTPKASFNSDIVWYEREIELPADWKGGLLWFEGVDYKADVYLNGKHVGQHKGAYAPFNIDISAHLESGTVMPGGGRKHVITLRAEDSRTRRGQLVGKQERQEPGRNQSAIFNEGVIFYENMIGIWKGVWIEKLDPKNHLADIKLNPTVQGVGTLNSQGEIEIRAKLARPENGAVLRARVRFEKDPKIVAQGEVVFEGDSATLKLPVTDPKLWAPGDSKLYYLDLELVSNGKVIEEIKSYTGFRTIRQSKGILLLNEVPYYLQGILDQVIYSRSLYTPESIAQRIRDIQMILEAGFTGARIHATTPSLRDLYLFDRMGLWVTIELPTGRDLRDPSDYAQAKAEAEEILKAFTWGRPSVIWVILGNEDWHFLEHEHHLVKVPHSVRARYQRDLYKLAVASIPGQILISTGSGWRNFTAMKDGKLVEGVDPERHMVDGHFYPSSGRELLEAHAGISKNPEPGAPTPDYHGMNLVLFEEGFSLAGLPTALILSEMGGQGFLHLIDSANIFAYGGLITNADEYARVTSDLIRSMGLLDRYSGYVLTQLYDAGNKSHRRGDSGGERNGILWADGRPKIDLRILKQANQIAKARWQKAHGVKPGPLPRHFSPACQYLFELESY